MSPKAGGGGEGRRRKASRLAAVQALYEIDMTQATAEAVLADAGPLPRLPAVENGTLPRPDRSFVGRLVEGVVEQGDVLDSAIAGALSAPWSLDRLETVLRAILRAGAYELAHIPDVPMRVVINEYVDIAHAFFAGREPALVNAVLDRLALRFRSFESGGSSLDDTGRP